jgi:demethoxyubiquinone hydroxylase (CLK1/Coq7/Cat5 family)
MKLSAFIAGTFGIVGFVLSIMAGLLVDTPVPTILFKAILWSGVCYVIGYFVGLMAQQVSMEHAQSIAKRVAESDAAKETQEAEELAKNAAELASGEK